MRGDRFLDLFQALLPLVVGRDVANGLRDLEVVPLVFEGADDGIGELGMLAGNVIRRDFLLGRFGDRLVSGAHV